jgi:outer membrane immunogenic protein
LESGETEVKSGFVVVAAAFVGITSASAADLPIKAPPMVRTYNWTGCYVGVEAGGTWGRTQHVDNDPLFAGFGLPLTNVYDVSGGLVGGTVGCNYQINQWVFGVENDLSWRRLQGNGPDIPPFTTTSTTSLDSHWLDTLRGRVGFAWDRVFVYGTAGVAFTQTTSGVCTVAAGCFSDTKSRTGWVAGAGAEWAVWNNISLKAEYLHVDYGSSTNYFSPDIVILAAGTVIATHTVPLTENIIRVGLNVKLTP